MIYYLPSCDSLDHLQNVNLAYLLRNLLAHLADADADDDAQVGLIDGTDDIADELQVVFDRPGNDEYNVGDQWIRPRIALVEHVLQSCADDGDR